MNKYTVFNGLIMCAALGVVFEVFGLVKNKLRVYEMWPPDMGAFTVILVMALFIFALGIRYSLKRIRSIDVPQYRTFFSGGLLISIGLYWILACIDVFIDY